MAQRRKFSAEFKREAVDLTCRPQASVSQVAQELGVNAYSERYNRTVRYAWLTYIDFV